MFYLIFAISLLILTYTVYFIYKYKGFKKQLENNELQLKEKFAINNSTTQTIVMLITLLLTCIFMLYCINYISPRFRA